MTLAWRLLRGFVGDAMSNLGWFNVKDYGATGNGSTDDTAAVNAAIAALVAAGRGLLYFPAGTYKCVSALTTISVPATILGDGGSGDVGHVYATPVSEVLQTSATANLFTVSANGCQFADIALSNTNGGTPSAGAGISMSAGYFARIEHVTVSRFYDCIDISNGAGWSITDCFIYDPVRYGLRIQGTISPDNGDQSIVGTYFMSDSHAGTSAIRYESAGGLKITNTKINARSSTKFVTGIDINPQAATGVFLMANTSIENTSGDAFSITTSGNGWPYVSIVGCEFGTYTGTGHAIKINCGTLGDVDTLVVSGCTFTGSTTSAIDLTKVNNAVLGHLASTGYTAILTQTGCTNINTTV